MKSACERPQTTHHGATHREANPARAGQTPGAHTLRRSMPPPTSAPPTPHGVPDPAHAGSRPVSTAASEASGAQAIWGRIPISPHDLVTDNQTVTKLGSDPEWPEGAHSTAAMLAPMLFRSSRRCHSPCAQHHFSANAGRRQGAWDGLNRQRLLESSCEL